MLALVRGGTLAEAARRLGVDASTVFRAVQRLERPFLHAARLVFTHPSDGRRMEFASPLPADLQSVLDDIRERQEPPDPDPM